MSYNVNKLDESPERRSSIMPRRDSLGKSLFNLKTNKVALIFKEFFLNKLNEYEEMNRKRQMDIPGKLVLFTLILS